MSNQEFNLFEQLIAKTLHVPTMRVNSLKVKGAPKHTSEKLVQQLDAVLVSEGFILSKDLILHLTSLHPVDTQEEAKTILKVVKQLTGNHVKHNSYFIDFPENVPDTMEFWAECIADALMTPASAGTVATQLAQGYVNLLDLPKYGKYLHTYEEMVEAHDAFIEAAGDRLTVLHAGDTLQREAEKVYAQLAESTVPLSESDRELLKELATVCTDIRIKNVPIRENKAVINAVRLEDGKDLIVDTVTDVLRLACVLSEGDVTLDKPTKFKSFSRQERKGLVRAIHSVVNKDKRKLADINYHTEQWKRLFKFLHPLEYAEANGYGAVLAYEVALGNRYEPTFGMLVQKMYRDKNYAGAVTTLTNAPGLLVRNLDFILRNARPTETKVLLSELEHSLSKVSGRVLLSLREYFTNRLDADLGYRIFANKKGTAYVTEDKRVAPKKTAVTKLLKALDTEVTNRLPKVNLLIDENILPLALPISQKQEAKGFGILPRGTVTPVKSSLLRFFMYWKQTADVTDYDLSVIMLDENFVTTDQISYTNLRGGGGKHSGDITNAPKGATEFIELDLDKVDAKYIIPQVNIYDGESFSEVEESFFGYMERIAEQKGLPFEPRTVQMKSEIRDKGKIVLPLAFRKNDDGTWDAVWMHLYLKGYPAFNRTELNRVSTSLIARGIVEREYLNVGYLVELMKKKAKVSTYDNTWDSENKEPVIYIGKETPTLKLPEGSKTITLANLTELIPA